MGPVGPAYTPVGAQTNTLAVVSLVTGIASFVGHVVPVVGGFVVAVIAIVTGFMARNQIKQTGEKGGGMALAGIVIGIVHLVLIGFGLMGFLLLVLVLGTCNSIAAR